MLSDGKYTKNSAQTNAKPITPIKSIIHNNYSNNNNLNNSTDSTSSATGVKFSGLIFKEKIDEREKYLTAKYPNHQMALIKKRLKVEFWIDEQLKILFNITVSIF